MRDGTFEDWDSWHFGYLEQWTACDLDPEPGLKIGNDPRRTTCPECLKWLEGSDTVPPR